MGKIIRYYDDIRPLIGYLFMIFIIFDAMIVLFMLNVELERITIVISDVGI